jgi:hypothetical protein
MPGHFVHTIELPGDRAATALPHYISPRDSRGHFNHVSMVMPIASALKNYHAQSFLEALADILLDRSEAKRLLRDRSRIETVTNL